MYLEDKLVGLAQFGRVLVELLVLLDLVVVRSIEQQLLDVSGFQPVGGHVHQDLTELGGGQLQMGDEDGCREEESASLFLTSLCSLLQNPSDDVKLSINNSVSASG